MSTQWTWNISEPVKLYRTGEPGVIIKRDNHSNPRYPDMTDCYLVHFYSGVQQWCFGHELETWVERFPSRLVDPLEDFFSPKIIAIHGERIHVQHKADGSIWIQYISIVTGEPLTGEWIRVCRSPYSRNNPPVLKNINKKGNSNE